MSKRFIFTKGALEALDYFTDQFMCGAVRKGIDTYVVDISRPETFNCALFMEFIRGGSCIAFMFNQVGLLLTDADGNNIWELYDIPVYDFIVDHPRNFADAFLQPIRTLHVLTPDKHHAAFIRRFYPAVEDVHIMQHGGAAERPSLPFEARDIPVLYVGDCQASPHYPDLPVLSGEEDGFYTFCCTRLLEDADTTTESAIESFFTESGRSVSEGDLLRIHQTASVAIEHTARRFYKQAAMRAMDRAGIPVEVYGNYWLDDNYVYGEQIRIHDRVSSAECNRLIGRAKICLNFMPWFKDGSNERVYNTMLNGALCVIDESSYMKTRFQDGRDIIFCRPEQPEQLAADIQWLLAHPAETAEIAARGYNAVRHDTWADRFDELLSILNDRSGR